MVIEDHSIGSSQIDTETTSTGTEQEDEDVRPRAMRQFMPISRLKILRTSFAIPSPCLADLPI